MRSGEPLSGRPLHVGAAAGPALVLDQPLSFWGGYSATEGKIIAEGHPQRGLRAAGRILVMPSEVGSSSSASVLAEAIRLGTAPAAIITGHSDGILVAGALVGAKLYDVVVPIIEASPADIARLETGLWLSVALNGECALADDLRGQPKPIRAPNASPPAASRGRRA
jgi:predicted aconitase with swiveling domain